MNRYISLILIIFTVFCLVAPHLADARAGGGGSMGSRGSRTYSTPSYAQPIQRSTTAKPTQPSPGVAQQGSNYGQQPAMAPSGSSFWRGFGGGLLGAGIGSMLFGHGAYGGGYGMGDGMGGGLLNLLLIGGLIYLAIRFFRGRPPLSGFNSPMNNAQEGNFSNFNMAAVQSESQPLNVTDSDKEYFEQLLQKIQHNWSEGDLTRLRQFVTPEMLQYFSEELSANASRGLANKVENVRLERASVLESWHEYSLDYATVSLEWSAFDYMVYLDKKPSDAGYVASGINDRSENAAEVWTFARSAGGNWLLSAIQQVN